MMSAGNDRSTVSKGSVAVVVHTVVVQVLLCLGYKLVVDALSSDFVAVEVILAVRIVRNGNTYSYETVMCSMACSLIGLINSILESLLNFLTTVIGSVFHSHVVKKDFETINSWWVIAVFNMPISIGGHVGLGIVATLSVIAVGECGRNTTSEH